ncbi:MAG: hypothetical protein Q8K68_11425, partial [Nitrospirota bacterium]|nr:hypothetical protein [Nitrospirota bacterium]
TNTVDVERLIDYRKSKAFQKAAYQQAMTVKEEIMQTTNTPLTDSLRRDTTARDPKRFKVRLPDNYAFCLQSAIFRKGLINHLESEPVNGHSSGATRHTEILLSNLSYDKLSKRAAILGFSLNTAFILAFLEYLQTTEGQTATLAAKFTGSHHAT